MTRFRDWPFRGLWKTGGHCTRNVDRDQVTRALACCCTRTSLIEEGDRISARSTYIGTLSEAFTGYQPNRTAVQTRASIIAREAWEAD